MIKVIIRKTTSVRVYMYSLHIHSYDQGYEYKIYFSESIYVFAAHTQLWSRLWVQKPLQWEYICIRCTYTAMIKVMITKTTSVRVYMYSLHIQSNDQGYDYKNHFNESIYVIAAHTQLWSRLWVQNLLQWEYICIRCTYTAMIKVMSTKSTSVRIYMYSLHIHSYDQGYEYKKPLQWEYICIRCTYTAMIEVMITKTTSVRVYMYSLHIHSYDQGYDYKKPLQWEYIFIRCTYTLQWKYICIRCTYTAMIKVMITKSTSVRVYIYSLHIHSYDQGYEYKIYFSESIYVFAAHTQLWSRLWLQKTTSVRVYMYSLHIHSYDQGYDYKNHFSESIYVFAAHTQLWSRLWVQNLLQWEYICIRCTYTPMIKVMFTKTTSVRVYLYSLYIHSYDQGYEYKIYFSESIYVFAAHTQLWSRLWLQKPLQWEYICIRCTYKAMIKVMSTKSTSVRVYMYSLHIHSYDQGYELQNPLQLEYICIRCTYTAMTSMSIVFVHTKLWSIKNFSESIYVFAAHTQLWSRLWVQKLLQWEYICIRCTYTAMIKVMVTKTTSVRVYMYSLHIHSYDQGYDYKNHFSESIYVFAAHTQLWSRLWVQNLLQWEYICIRCTYTAMIKVMITKTTSVRVYMYSLHIHSYDQGYEYKIYFSESIYVFAAHTQLWSRLWLQKPLQWEYICIRCTYTAMIKVMSTKSTSVRVYMYSLHIHSYDQGYDYKNHFSESIYVFAAHTQLWSRLWLQKPLQWEYICIRCTYTAMIKVMITKTTSVRVYMYSLHIHSYDQGYDYKNHFSESIFVFAAHTQLWSRLWVQNLLQWEYICIRCTYTAMLWSRLWLQKAKITSVRVYMYSLHIHSYDQGYEYKMYFSESIYVFAAHTQLWSRLWLQKTTSVRVYMYSLHIHSYDQGYDYKNHISDQEYICIRCTYTAMIKVMSTKSTSVRVYMYSLHIHSYDQGYELQKPLQWEYICIRCTYTAMIKVMITKTTSVRVYMYSLHIHSYDQGYEYKIYFSESIYVFAAHTQLWSRLWVQNLLQWEYICIRCTYTAMIKVMITKTTSVRVYMYSLHIHSYDQGYDYKNHFSESIYVFAAHTQLWSRLWVQNLLQWEYICIRCTYTAMIKVMSTKSTSVRVYMYSLHIQSYDQCYDYKKPLQWEYICIRCTYTAMIKVMITKTTSVRVYMYSLHIHSYDQGYEYKTYFSESIYVFAAHTQLWSRLCYKNHFSESIYVFAAHTQLWSRLWLQKTTSVRVYMYSLHIHSYDQGYDYKNHFSESIYVFAAHTQAKIKVMITKSTSVRVYMYSLHIHSYDQGYEYKIYFSESIYVFAAHTQLWSRLWLQKAMITSVRVYMYSLHIHSYDQGYDYKNHFSESIYVFAAHTQLWSRLWVQNLLQWEYICIRCTYTAMIKVMITNNHFSESIYVFAAQKQGFSESIYVFAAHTKLWSRLWLQKPLQWEYICIRCTYTAMIKVMSTKTTSVRVYMYSLHIHSYDQGYG